MPSRNRPEPGHANTAQESGLGLAASVWQTAAVPGFQSALQISDSRPPHGDRPATEGQSSGLAIAVAISRRWVHSASTLTSCLVPAARSPPPLVAPGPKTGPSPAPQSSSSWKQTLDSTVPSMFLLFHAVCTPSFIGLPALGLGQPGRILTASAIYTPFDGSSFW